MVTAAVVVVMARRDHNGHGRGRLGYGPNQLEWLSLVVLSMLHTISVVGLLFKFSRVS